MLNDYLWCMFIETKLYPPETSESIIDRERLSKQITDAITSSRHILVSAGAGFGKSTLIVQTLRDSSISPVWYSLDMYDNKPHKFYRYLIKSICKRYGLQEISIDTLLHGSGTDTAELVMEAIVHLLISIEGQITLVFDDFHLIEEVEILRFTEYLLKRNPGNLVIIILSRFDPPISISKLRLSGKITEIRESDLRFTRQEIIQLLEHNRTENHQIARLTDVLQHKTEGWPVGLMLGIMAYKQEKSGESFIERFSGSHMFVADYLLEEVLGNLTGQEEELLLISSLFERFSVPLLEELLNQDPDIHFQRVSKKGFFLIHLDEENEWFRLHHLVRELLKKRVFTIWKSEQVKNLYLRAGRWFEERSLTEEAVQSYYHAGNMDQLIRIISINGLRIIASGDFKILHDWLSLIPDNLRLSTLDLCIIEGWIATIDQRVDRIEYISSIADHLKNSDKTNHIEDTSAHLSLIKASYLVQKDGTRPEDVEQLLSFAESNTNTSNLLLHSTIQLFRGNFLRMSGELDKSLVAYQKTLLFSLQLNDFSLIIPTTTAVCEIYMLQGNLKDALGLLETTLSTIHESFSESRLPKIGLLYVLISMIQFEINQIDDACTQLQKAREISEKTNDFNSLVICHDLEARINTVKNDLDSAQISLDHAISLSEKHQLLYYSSYLVHTTFLIRKKRGNKIAIEHCLDLVARKSKWYGFWLGQLELTKIKTLYELNRYAEALVEIQSLLEQSILKKAKFVAFQANCWLSVTYRRLGKKTESLEILHQTLIFAKNSDTIRPYLEIGSEMYQMLKEYVADKRFQGVVSSDFIHHVFKQFEHEQRRTPDGLSEPLTERELEVLRLMATGLKNQEIGNQLFLAVGTVKKHSFIIFQKLNVNNRIQAVQKAKTLGLI